ncbi:MAG TPA: hypothetical protein VLY83_00190, partial [Methanoregula sp.]|nr:hypothetical protein [Methanoregula sp.]
LQTYSWNDGDMAWYQFPSFTQAPSDQNLAKYANEHNIRIFPITLGTDDEIQPGYSGNGSSEWQIYNTMDLIASETNGTHYAATDGDQLGDVYTAIAGQLNQVAGGSTTVDLNMSTFNFFDHVATNLTNFLDYVPIGTSGFPGNLLDSTHIVKFNGSSYSYSGFPYTQNDQQNWTAKDMKYSVGNINLNDTWGIRFTFNVTNPGKITLFGPDSPATVTFQDSSTTSTTSAFINQITLPCQDSVVNGGFSTHHISVDNLSQVAGANQNPNIWTIQWNTTYDGTDSNVDEQISYWGQDGIEHIVPNAALLWVPKGNEVQQSFTVDATDPSLWPNNQVITIKVKAWASDTGEDHDTIQIYKTGANAPNYIKLQ